MSVYRDIYQKISASQAGLAMLPGRTARIIKLQEEVGEVSQAYIGFLGANARKGYSHTGQDVAKELADVVITAMVALHDWTDSPEQFVKEHLQGLLERIKEEGS
jgi:NTP pyrophosphatase (non-canonical NTP hydrolase)